jgi:transcriptional regulator GlxA family with amidase domain
LATRYGLAETLTRAIVPAATLRHRNSWTYQPAVRRAKIQCPIGISVATDPFDRAEFDTLITGGGTEPPTLGLIKYVRRAHGRCRRIAAICTGVPVASRSAISAPGPKPGRGEFSPAKR